MRLVLAMILVCGAHDAGGWRTWQCWLCLLGANLLVIWWQDDHRCKRH